MGDSFSFLASPLKASTIIDDGPLKLTEIQVDKLSEKTANRGILASHPIASLGQVIYLPYEPSSSDGFLPADGAAVSRTTYAALFAKIGTKFGAGDGSTTFNLPNVKGRVIVGYDPSDSAFNDVGKTGGEKTHLLSGAESGTSAHSHELETVTVVSGGATGFSHTTTGTATTDDSTKNSSAANAASAHNNLQPFEVHRPYVRVLP